VSVAVKLEFLRRLPHRANAVLQMHSVGGEIVDAHPGAFVGVGDRAAVLQSPLSGRSDGTVDAARADDAAVTIQGRSFWNVAGTCTIIVTLSLPVPSSA
jgi:hypothetical protein